MPMRIVIVILTFLILPGCNQTGKYYPPGLKDTLIAADSKTGGLDSAAKIAGKGVYEHDLQLFCNHEIALYCVLLPLDEFIEDRADASAVKARHKFLLRQDSSQFTSIEVQAFTIDKKNHYNAQLFYKKDKKDIAEGGLGIDTGYIDEAGHYYLIKGYLPNYRSMKFIQLNWILENKIAVYINYDVKDETLWMKRVAAIITRGPAFSDK